MQLILLGLFAISPLYADAAQPTEDLFEQCMMAVLEKKPGHIIKVEKKIEARQQMYEFNVRARDGLDWDVECVRATGEIWEIEREVQNPNDPLFKQHVKVGERAARKIVLQEYPGHIVEVEYEIESDGTAVYEFDIEVADGGEMKVEVNTETGEIHEANREVWQIGIE